MAEKRVIKISAEVEPTLKGMDQIIQKLQNGLSKGSAQIDFTKGAGKQVSRLFDTFTEEYKKFQSLTKNGNLDILDSKKALQSGEKIISTFRELQRIVGDFSSLTVVDAKKLFPEAFDKRVDDARESLRSISKTIDTLNSKKVNLAAAETQLKELKTQLNELEEKFSTQNKFQLKVDDAEASIDRLQKKYQKLQNNIKQGYLNEQANLPGLIKDAQTKEEVQRVRMKKYGTRKGELTYNKKTASEWENDKNASSEAKKIALDALKNYEQENNKLAELVLERKNLQKRAKAVSNILADANKTGDFATAINNQAGNSKSGGISAADIENSKWLLEITDKQTAAQEKLRKAEANYQAEQEKNKSVIKRKKQITAEIERQEAQTRKLKAEIENTFANVDFEKIKNAFASIGVTNITEETIKTKKGIERLKELLNQLDSRSLEKLKSNLKDIGVSADQADNFVDKFRDGMGQAGKSVQEFTSHQKEVEQFRDRLLQFFSISNSVQLFKRAIRSAFETVKELDNAMTEIAVVSDFSVGDMWGKLPEFTAQANELGVAVKDTYNATALYIQQGMAGNLIFP